MLTKERKLRGILMPRLREIREEKQVSRQALADDTGLDYSFLWKVETGKSGISYVAANAVAERLSVTVDSLSGHVSAEK